jgi:hypothetical protein
MTVVRFVRVPEWFVQHHHTELAHWARNIRAINETNAREGLPPNTKRVVFREGCFADVSPDPSMGPVTIQVTLHMKVTRADGKFVGGVYKQVASEVAISPYTEADEELIRKYVQKMEGYGVDPFKKLTEHPRAGIPFMPSKLWIPPGTHKDMVH